MAPLNASFVRFRIVLFVFLSFAITGCTSTALYNPGYEPRSEYRSESFPGRALILTDSASDQMVVSQSPSSFTGGGTTMNIHIGEIVRKSAQTAFGNLFAEGADVSNDSGSNDSYVVIVEPRHGSIDFQFNQLQNAGFAITPKAQAQVLVAVTGKGGDVLLDKTYDSGLISGETYFMSGSPSEKANQVIHTAIGRAIAEAANDLRRLLRSSGSAP